MRSRREILFRLRQEAANLGLLAAGDRSPDARALPLPDPQAVAEDLRGTPYAAEVLRIASEILAHRFPLLGFTIETGPEIDWRRDYVHGISSEARYFRFVPYLDFSRVGDHKIVWELNRHQHWVLLAQAWLLTGDQKFLAEIRAQFESWTRANPPMRGINWTSALEVAFRALSWMWVLHLAGSRMNETVRQRFLAGLWRHGRYLERNLSFYFSPNTHLLGEAAALHALGLLLGMDRWRELGGRTVRDQMDAQVREDGSHFEQSSYYHVYALDMFLFHRVLAGADPAFDAKLARMADFLAALMGPARTLPFLGDDDGGRFFHPFGPRDQFGRATLASASLLLEHRRWSFDARDAHEQAAWWIGPRAVHASNAAGADQASRLFPDAGIAAMYRGAHILVDAGGFGYATGGHSHSDTLSIVARLGPEELLIDPGTFTYLSDPARRDYFRGSAAHNTVRIDGADQATPQGPFRWAGRPGVEILEWKTTPECDYLDARCAYSGFVHRRRVLFSKPHALFVVDTVEGPPGERLLEQFWHAGAEVEPLSQHMFRIGPAVVLFTMPAEIVEGWRSRALGHAEPAPVLRVSQKATLPATYGTILDLEGARRPCDLKALRRPDGAIELHFALRESGTVRFPPSGFPEIGTAEPGTGHPVPRCDA